MGSNHLEVLFQRLTQTGDLLCNMSMSMSMVAQWQNVCNTLTLLYRRMQ